MLVCTVIDELSKEATQSIDMYTTSTPRILCYFFCQARHENLNNATAVLRGLIYLLLDKQKSLETHIPHTYSHSGKRLLEDTNAWVVLSQMLRNMLLDPDLQYTTFIIDALDECETELPDLLDLIVQLIPIAPNVKLLLSSRKKPDIYQRLNSHTCPTMKTLNLEDEANSSDISNAVNVYINERILDIPVLRADISLRAKVHRQLKEKANGTYLWIGLVIQALQKATRWKVSKVINDMPKGLNQLYGYMFEQIMDHDEETVEYCIAVLSAIGIAYRPLHLKELVAISRIPPAEFEHLDVVETLLKFCGSFLTIKDQYVFVIHQSAHEFLIAKQKDGIFLNGIRSAHHNFFMGSIEIMSKTLRRDVYGLDNWGISADKVEVPSTDPLQAVRCSCVHWTDHLAEGEPGGHLHENSLADDGITSPQIPLRALPPLARST